MTLANEVRAACASVLGLFTTSTLAQVCEPGWVSAAGTSGFNNTVRALTVWDPDGPGHEPELLVFGGSFTAVGPMIANGVAAWDGIGWRTFGAGFDITPNTAINALTVYNGELFAGGSFLDTGGVRVPYLAVWRNSSWKPVGDAPNRAVSSLASFGGELYVGGDFSRFGGTTTYNVARWNGTLWRSLGTGLYRFFPAACIGLYADTSAVLAVGCFDSTDSVVSPDIAAWNGSQWSGFGAGINDGFCGVSAATRFGSLIVATGEFSEAGNMPANRIASWNGSMWSPLGAGLSGTGLNPKPGRAVFEFKDNLYVGGSFSVAGSASSPGFARWNGTQWVAAAGGVSFPTTDDGVFALLPFQGELIVAGKFSAADSSPRQNWARWSADGRPTIIRQPLPVSLDQGLSFELSVTPGTAYDNVDVQWFRDGFPIFDGLQGASPGGGQVSGAAVILASPTNGSPVTLSIQNARASDSGVYTAQVSNLCGTRESIGVEVIITAPCPADFNTDGFVDDTDFVLFTQQYGVFDCSDPAMPDACSADLNADGFVDDTDFVLFTQAYAAFVCD